jgi:hypothetical protein
MFWAELERASDCIEKFWRIAIENNPRIFDCAADENRRIVNTKN